MATITKRQRRVSASSTYHSPSRTQRNPSMYEKRTSTTTLYGSTIPRLLLLLAAVRTATHTTYYHVDALFLPSVRIPFSTFQRSTTTTTPTTPFQLRNGSTITNARSSTPFRLAVSTDDTASTSATTVTPPPSSSSSSSSSTTTTANATNNHHDVDLPTIARVSYSHIHMYVDTLHDLEVYKRLENKITQFSNTASLYNTPSSTTTTTTEAETNIDTPPFMRDGIQIQTTSAQSIWSSLTNHPPLNEDEFVPQNRDVVQQLIVGLGFRITGARYEDSKNEEGVRTLLLTTSDPNGVRFLVSSVAGCDSSSSVVKKNEVEEVGAVVTHEDDGEEYRCCKTESIREFYQLHSNRQGIAVLGFEVSSDTTIDSIYQRYVNLHPNLVPNEFRDGPVAYSCGSANGNDDTNTPPTEKTITTTRILEVFAYYHGEKGGTADRGTRLQFVQTTNQDGDVNNGRREGNEGGGNGPKVQNGGGEWMVLPGLEPIDAVFDDSCLPAYFDHWVSNVIDRERFIETLEETLGFTPKVDFNAGVVAAGEAQIESTVTGNDSSFSTLQKEFALRDQSQVYLPINNALSEVGHVHGFLEEVGQGIQHIASRVDDLASFVQRGNDFRRITGEGFTFLKIPRSYYGVLTPNQLTHRDGQSGKEPLLSSSCAFAIMEACEQSGIIASDASVDLNLSRIEISTRLRSALAAEYSAEFESCIDQVVDAILASRYSNLYTLLGDILPTEMYVAIVRNQILVDVQGEDVLLQIFTSNVLQRKIGEEAPFFEFIQRVCGACDDGDCAVTPIKAGCGGFGIRNFLTLFLSIEVGKATVEVSNAKARGDLAGVISARRRVSLFTDQLNESNPILTEIADAMAAEGRALDRLREAEVRGDWGALKEYRKEMEAARVLKEVSNTKLMACSAKYNDLMKAVRLSGK